MTAAHAYVRPRTPGALALALAITAVPVAAAPADAPPVQAERVVKADYLSKIAHYVEWPAAAVPAPGAPLTLCVMGTDPFGRAIDDAVTGQSIGDHPLVVRRIPDVTQWQSCNLAFVRGANARVTAQMLTALRGKPVLTFTDSRNGAPRGMIHFAMRGGRVGFHIDNALAAESSIGISSRLLGIALSVRQRRT